MEDRKSKYVNAHFRKCNDQDFKDNGYQDATDYLLF